MKYLVEMMGELVCQDEVMGSLEISICRRRYDVVLECCTEYIGNEENVVGEKKEREERSQRC
jgi:hypothetical protein